MKKAPCIRRVRILSRRIPAHTQKFAVKVGLSMIPASLYTFGVEQHALSVDEVQHVFKDTTSVEMIQMICKILVHNIR